MGNTPVDPVVEMLIGGEWVDVTADTRLSSADSGGGISITRGVANEGTSAEPTELDFTLNNREGKYSPGNPNSPYWGLLGRNQQVRVGLNRVRDDFERSDIEQTLGLTPDKDLGNGLTKPGLEWDYIGTSERWEIAGNTATFAATTGVSIASFGAYADCDVLVKTRTSNLDTAFGIAFRVDPSYSITPISTHFAGGVSGWFVSGGSLSQTTALLWNDQPSALLLVSGSPSQAYARPTGVGAVPVTPGQSYRAKMRVRSPGTPSVLAAMDWYDSDFNYLSTSVSSTAVLTADTWTYLEVQANAPVGAAFMGYGPTLTSSPANGTQLVFNDLRVHTYAALQWYTARFSPASPDQIHIEKTVPGSSNWWLEDAEIDANEWYYLRLQCRGQSIRARFWHEDDDEPADWTIVIYDGEDYEDIGVPPKAGRVGLYVQGGTGTVEFEFIEVNQWKAHAEIAELPQRYDLSRNDRWVPVQARGILRRLSQGRKALEPPVTLHFESYMDGIVGWWPFETGSDTLSPNRVSGGKQAQITGITFGTDDALPGVAAVATVNSDTMRISTKAKIHTNTGAWTHFMYLGWDDPPASATTLVVILCAGTGIQFRIIANTDGSFEVWVFGAGGTLIQSSGAFGLYGTVADYGDWIATALYVYQDGSNLKWVLNFHKPGDTSFYTTGEFTLAGTAGRYIGTEFFGVANHNTMGFKFAHVLGYSGDLPFVGTAFARAARAYNGELMMVRFRRLCENAGIPYLIFGLSASGDETMGPQPAAKTLELLEECAQVQDATLMEDRDSFALVLRTRKSMYVQRATEMDLDAGHVSAPNEPTTDDQLTRNDVTVTGAGSSARSVQESGPLNVSEPEDDPDGVGVYDTEVARNVSTGEQLPPIANWYRHKGTQPDPRYPALVADLLAAVYDADPYLTAELASLDIGDMTSVVNTEVSPDPTEQIIKQAVDKIDQYEMSRSFVTTPGAIYRVGQLGYTTRVGTSNHVTTAEFVSGTDTSLTIERIDANGKRWVRPEDQAAAFPMEILVGGVRLNVTDVDGTTDPQTMTVDQAPVNGVIKTIPAGTPIRVYRPWRLAW